MSRDITLVQLKGRFANPETVNVIVSLGRAIAEAG